MSRSWQRFLGIALVVFGVTGFAATGISHFHHANYAPRNMMGYGQPNMMAPPAYQGSPTAACEVPTIDGEVVDVRLADMMGGGTGGMMMNGRMMSVTPSVPSVSTGDVSFRVFNTGWMTHELVILPLPSDGAGTRPIGSDGRVSEAGSLGEVSASCGEGAGEGIAPGAASWVTLHLAPGRYELICNLPGHYAAGMFAELDVR